MSTTDFSSHCALTENCSTSELKVDKVVHVWTIINFDFFEAVGTALESPVFSASTNDKVRWFMKLKPNGDPNNKDTVGLFLNLSDSSECKTVFAKNSVSILNNKHEKEFVLSTPSVREFIVGADNKNWGWNCICKKDKNFRENLLSNNVLKISCEVIFSTKSDAVIEHHYYQNAFSHKPTIAKCGCTEDLAMLWQTNHLSDVIISVRSENYPAHKAILTVRSKVFASMFKHDTKENQLNRIEIEDLDEEIVGEMLRFIYTGNCEKLDDLAGGLLAAADKYDVDGLRVICSEALFKTLSIENAAQNLMLADMHNAKELKVEVMKFIVAKSTEVFNTLDWKSVLANPRLIDEVCRAMSHR